MKQLRFVKMIAANLELFALLTQREIVGPYKGAALGLWWSVLLPLLMLAIYTFIFSNVFQARWGGDFTGSGRMNFAANLFAGLIVFNFFSECLRKAPRLITANPNFIKKIIFPVEILGAVTVGAACFNASISVLILIGFQLITHHALPLTIAWLPVIWLPLLLITMALTWAISAIGVFLRDIDQAIGVGLNVLMFLSPIFYPATALPRSLQKVLLLNPIASVIEQTRRCSIQGLHPNASYLLIALPLAIVICELSYRIFYRTRKAFADAL